VSFIPAPRAHKFNTLGVTKGAFYWQFDGRGALLEEMLDAWERTGVDAVIEIIEGGGGDARAKLRRLFALATSPEGEGLRMIELAVRDWARRDKAVAKRLRRVDNRRNQYMRSLFGDFCRGEKEIEARCLLFASLGFGNSLFAADHGAQSREEVADLAVRRLLA
jgi:AcrR family transcriptional regulator